MNCAVQCLNAQIFDWSTTLLDCMKRQLTECRMQRHKNFGFGTILCAFFFERVPSLSPREIVRGHVASSPAVNRWATLLPRQGGGRTIEAFDDKFFYWWSRQIPAIEDYPYARIDFSRDPDMGVPPGVVRGELGKLSFQSYLIFMLFLYISFFLYIRVSDRYVSVMCRCGASASSGLCEDQATSSTRGHTATVGGPAAVGGPPAGEAERVLRWVEWNLTSLTRTVPMAEIEDLPPSMQPHVVGVPRTWVHLFRHLENMSLFSTTGPTGPVLS
jgi:hypothetical protein